MKFTEAYDKLKTTEIQLLQFEEKILWFEDFKLVGFIKKWKEGNQLYFVNSTFSEKWLNFIKNNIINLPFNLFLENWILSEFTIFKQNIEKYFSKFDLSKFGFKKLKIDYSVSETNWIFEERNEELKKIEFEKTFEFDQRTWTITAYLWSEPFINIPLSINGSLVKEIWSSAFSNKRLTQIIIPNSVVAIWNFAFSNNQLTNVIIPNSVKRIWNFAFTMNKLTNVEIPNSVKRIWDSAFSINQLTNVEIPNSVDTIWYSAFSWNQLTNVIIPNSVIKIWDSAFCYNKNLKEISISENTEINNQICDKACNIIKIKY